MSVTLEKLKRDTDRLRRFARFAIVVNHGIVEIVDNEKLFREKRPFASLIAVLGSIGQNNQGIDPETETVILEIGYFRSRPYAQVEWHAPETDGRRRRNQRWYLTPRIRARNISDEELRVIYPALEQCIAQIVIERRETWKTKGRWWVPGPGAVERGIYFTVDKSDRSLYRQLLAEDVRFRKERYMRGHAARISRLIGHYRSSYYSRRQLERFVGAEKVANLVRDTSYWNPFYRRALLECFKPGSHTRTVLERMDEFFKFGFGEASEYGAVLYDETGPKLSQWKSIRGRVVEQGRIQASGRIVIEITLERKFREHNECPF
jgi:hypothetical protein